VLDLVLIFFALSYHPCLALSFIKGASIILIVAAITATLAGDDETPYQFPLPLFILFIVICTFGLMRPTPLPDYPRFISSLI
jgi:hypothetical protein